MAEQNILSLGIDTKSFSKAKKDTLTQFVSLFDQLAKYDGKVFNPILGEGLLSFNKASKETNALLVELNKNIDKLSQGFVTGGGNVTKMAKDMEKMIATVRLQQKEIIALRLGLSDVSKELISLSNNQSKATSASAVNGNSIKSLSNDYKILKQNISEASEKYTTLFLSKGKNNPQTKAALKEYSQSVSVVNDIDKQLNKASDSAGKFGEGLRNGFSYLRSIAYILPGLGIAGIFNLAFEAIGNVIESIGIFDNKTLKLIDDQLGLNEAYKDFNNVLKDIAETYKSDLGDTQVAKNRLAMSEAEGKSTLSRLEAEKEIIRISSLKANQLFFSKGGFTKQDELQLNLIGRESEYRGAKKSEDEYIPDNYMGYSKPDPKVLELAKSNLKRAQDDYNEIKKINENNASLSVEYKAKLAQIDEFNAEQKRKLTLENAKIESKSVIEKNSIILADEISTQKQRIDAINSIKDAAISANNAQKRYILNKPDARNPNGELTTESKVSLSELSESSIEATRKANEKKIAINEYYSQRLIKANTEIAKNNVNVSAIANERVYKDDTKSLSERLNSYAEYISKKQDIEELEYKKDISSRSLKSNDPVVKAELEKLKSDRDTQKINLQADYERQVYEIVYTSLDKQLKSVLDTNKLEDNENARKYTENLKKINDYYESGEITQKEFIKRRKALDKDYNNSFYEKEIDNDNKNLLRLQSQLDKLKKLRKDNEENKDLSKAILKDKKQNGGSALEEEKQVSEYNGKENGFDRAISDTEKEIQKAQDAKDKDEIDRQKKKFDLLLEGQKEYAKNREEIINALYNLAKTAIDGEIEKRIDALRREREIVDENFDSQKNAIDKSSLKAKDKAALEIQLAQQKKEYDKASAKEEKALKREKAIEDRALSIAHILWSTSESISSALVIPPPLGEAIAIQRGVLGAIQLATVLATPIPYKFGTPNGGHPGGLAEYGEDGPELVKEPYKSPYLVTDRHVSFLPKGTEVIPMVSGVDVNTRQKDESWEQAKYIAKAMGKSKNQKTIIKNTIIVDLGFESYKASKLYGI